MEEINEADGCKVIISIAGMSAILGGVNAADTTKPVIGLPLSGKNEFNNLAAITATAQLPPGSGEVTVGLDATENAALAAIRILALFDNDIKLNLQAYANAKRDSTLAADRRLNEGII